MSTVHCLGVRAVAEHARRGAGAGGRTMGTTLAQQLIQEGTQGCQIEMHGVFPTMDLRHSNPRHFRLLQPKKKECPCLFGEGQVPFAQAFMVALNEKLKDVDMGRFAGPSCRWA